MSQTYIFDEVTITLTENGAGSTTIYHGPQPTTQDEYLARAQMVNQYLEEIQEGKHTPE